MRISQLRIALVIAMAAASLPAVATATAQLPTSVTFFGDSFLDSGNGDIIAAMLGFADPTPSPPYFPGRITNGMNWADLFASQLGRPNDASPSMLGGKNYAIGTATTGTTGTMNLPLGMLSQYAQQAGTPADPTGLYVLFGGANDILGTATLTTPALQEAVLQSAIGNLTLIAQGLYSQGARSFLIPNLPNIGLAPVALGTPASSLFTAESQRFNLLLGGRLAVLSASLPGSKFFGLSLDVLFNNILSDARNGGPQFGLTNTTVPCLLVAVPCASAVFADQLHPTTAVDQLIANAAYARVVQGVDVPSVPEPSTLLLSGAGLALLAVAAKRRKNA